MILFTGHGDVALSFISQFGGEAISLRNSDDKTLLDWLTRAEVVIHNASNLSPVNLIEAFEHNVIPTKRLIDLLVKSNFQGRLVFLSSMSLLSNSETYKLSSTLSDYSLSKFICEQYILHSGLNNFGIVRFSTIYYGQPKKDGLSFMVDSALRHHEVCLLNNGIARRDFIPLEIAVKYLKLVASYNGNRKIFNLCSGREYSFFELAQMIQLLLPHVAIRNEEATMSNDFVLSSFDTAAIKELGVIDFSLLEKIKDQINRNESSHI